MKGQEEKEQKDHNKAGSGRSLWSEWKYCRRSKTMTNREEGWFDDIYRNRVDEGYFPVVCYSRWRSWCTIDFGTRWCLIMYVDADTLCDWISLLSSSCPSVHRLFTSRSDPTVYTTRWWCNEISLCNITVAHQHQERQTGWNERK